MTKPERTFILFFLTAVLILTVGFVGYSLAQEPQAAKVDLGSKTAKDGFKNEDEIRDKFNNWKLDTDARGWLAAMNYKVAEIESVAAGATASACANTERLD